MISIAEVLGTLARGGCRTAIVRRRQVLTATLGLALSCTGSSPEGGHAATAYRGVAPEGKRRLRDALPPFAPHQLDKMRARLAPLHAPASAPKPGEWRFDHPEPGQRFAEYLASGPTVPTPERRTIAVLPLGELGAAHREIVTLVTEYIQHHFGLAARTEPSAVLEAIPPRARRERAGGTQLLTRWLLDDVLPARLPRDAAALIAFVREDLWPGEGWNFVFGEATLERRVGVWSLARYGDPGAGAEAFTLALRRALKIAVHETGHMFSMRHCTAYACVQAGVNSLEEADVSPLWLCPECLAKTCWATSTDPRAHLEAVGAFCKRHRLDEEAAFFDKSRAVLA